MATRLFTTTEAAALTRLPLKVVNNAIDRKTVAAITGRTSGRATRLLDMHGLMSLTLERRFVDRLMPDFRRALCHAMASESGNTISFDDGSLKIDLREPRRELATAVRTLRRATQLVITDREIFNGDPVFRGTRIQVHLIAGLLKQGATEADLLKAYPRLTPAMIRAAPIFAEAYPQRGRPRTPPKPAASPAHRVHRGLATIAAE